jgi:hypothetical protein
MKSNGIFVIECANVKYNRHMLNKLLNLIFTYAFELEIEWYGFRCMRVQRNTNIFQIYHDQMMMILEF